jgi:para-nitrobenzyl esterase
MARQFTDQKFACPADALRRTLARYVPVWGYEFADPAPPIVVPRWLTPYDMGAYHASDLTYVFGTRWAFADPARFTPEQSALSERMGDLWAGFGREGFEAQWARAEGGAVKVFTPGGDRMDASFAARHQCGFWATTVFGPVGATT